MLTPSTHPWMRGLFGDPDLDQIFAPEAELRRFLTVEAAWTRALGTVAKAADSGSIACAIETAPLVPGDLQDGFAKDGVPIPALVRRLKDHLPRDAAPLVHDGLTSQDVMDTALMLALVEVLAVLSTRLAALDGQLAALHQRFGVGRVMAFTRMQPALETHVGIVIDRWRQPVSRLQDDLARITTDCRCIQWGGPIGVRDHPQAGALGAAFAKQLNFKDPGQAWHTDRTVVSDVGHGLTRIATLTGKIGEDIALMAALGPDHIVLDGGASSAMPHKNNPVKAETLITLAVQAGALQSLLTQSARHEGFRSGQAWALEWLTLPQLCGVAGAGLIQAAALLASINSMGQA